MSVWRVRRVVLRLRWHQRPVATFGVRPGMGLGPGSACSAQVRAQQVWQGVGGGGGSDLHLVPGPLELQKGLAFF